MRRGAGCSWVPERARRRRDKGGGRGDCGCRGHSGGRRGGGGGHGAGGGASGARRSWGTAPSGERGEGRVLRLALRLGEVYLGWGTVGRGDGKGTTTSGTRRRRVGQGGVEGAWHGEESSSARGKRAVKGWGATRGCHGEQEVAGAGPERRAALRRWTEEVGREGGGRRSWTSL